ncbi:MAG: threonine synthase [Candidatus Omnitrophica bacterium]|nr:threonine synthase [Candidatus Omnitrophota bacterium]MCM8802807.1 threonine synthase [Candidatus Omnitrophota bacterium]
MGKILYRSTNRKSDLVTFKEAVLKGQPSDYGLFIPIEIPLIKKDEIDSFKNKQYYEIAFDLLSKFLEDDTPPENLFEIVKNAYNFEIPLKNIDENLYILYLDRGPTFSFKDFAARFMAGIMEYYAKQDNINLTVLVATSGDTGGAIANAFYEKDNVKVVILFPKDEITEIQRKQMTTLGKNIIPIALKGKFDDCQHLVKIAFNDPDLKNLTSANSINIARLLPQSIYYFYSFSRLNYEKICFSVPSGNFGNLMGGVIAKKMGLPVEKFIVAVNENDEFPNFLKTGVYKPVIPSKKCISNAMNVGHPSNLARLIDLYGGWIYDERKEDGKVIKFGILKEKPDMEKLKNDFVSFSITDEEVVKTIKEYYKKYKIILDPHGAVGICAYEKANLSYPVISIETAHPGKFSEVIKNILGFEPEIPEGLKNLILKQENYNILENNYKELKEFLMELK